jgi:hypothetical protein
VSRPRLPRLMSKSRFQAAQFCEELQQAMIWVSGPRSFFSDGNGSRYGLRLGTWWDEWHESEVAADPDKTYEVLSQGFSTIQRQIATSSPKRYGAGPTRETLRLEFWVRDNPRSHRRLTMWANSSEPLRDRMVLRHAELEVNSSTATVRSFVEGRPQHWDQEELTGVANSIQRHTRWRSYLSVPIYVRVPDARVLVGAVTIASTEPKRSSALPFPKTEHTKALMETVINLGRKLFNQVDDD